MTKPEKHELEVKYQKEIVPTLIKEFGISNKLAVPKLTRISVNVGLGEALTNKNVLGLVENQLAAITGQKAAITRAKRSIATFKLRAGSPIGLKVTLRGARMFAFFHKLTAVVFPRMRDFHGAPRRNFDGRGNYSLGLTEQTLFPEINFDQIDKVRGMQITLVTTAKNDKLALRLFELMGFPFTKGDR